MSKPGAVVNGIRTHHRASEFLNQVVIFIGTFCRGQRRKFLSFTFIEFLGDQLNSLFPGRFNEFSVFFDQGSFQSIRMIYKIETVAPLNTETSLVRGTFIIGPGTHYPVTLDSKIYTATHTAK